MLTLAPRRALLATCGAMSLAACGQILGFPDDTLPGAGGAGTTSTTSSSAASTTGTVSSTGTTSTTGSGGGGGSGGGACKAGAMQPCYDGPAGTEGVGACKAGSQTCDGASWGPCVGEQPPRVEDCTTAAVDESCDGLPACTGAYRWARRFGDVSGQYGDGLAVDAAGNVVVVGRVAGAIDFGGGPLTAMGNDAFVAVLDARGNHVWSKVYGDASAQIAVSVATDAARNIVVVGSLDGTIDFGGGPLTSVSPKPNGFVAKLDPSGGHLWSRALGDAGLDVIAVGVDATGDAIVAGHYQGSPDLGTGPLPLASKARTFVAKLDKASGNTAWVQPFTSTLATDLHTTTSLAVDGAGDVVVGLTYNGSVIPPGGGAVASCATQGGYVVKLAGADGSAVWAWGTCNATAGSGHVPGGLGADGANDVFVAGTFTVAIDLGVGGLRPSAGSSDVYFVKLDHATGAPLVGAVFGDASPQRGLSVAVDAAGNFTLAGPSSGPIDFGGGPVAISGGGAFLAKFDGTGSYLWSRGFSDVSNTIDTDLNTADGYRALATFPTGELAWTTGFAGTTDLGGGMLVSQGANDVLVAVVAP